MKMEVVYKYKGPIDTEASAERRVYLNGVVPAQLPQVTLEPRLNAISSLASLVKSVIHPSSPPSSPCLFFLQVL